MGTRNLTCVVLDGEYKVAQYGQWDGYPESSGVRILNFLANMDRVLFEEKLKALREVTDDEIDKINADIEARGLQDKWQAEYPALTRDTGVDILQLIHDSPPGMGIRLHVEFAADSLFCEWAYVLDMDRGVLEVYKGFNKQPVPEGERFAEVKGEGVAEGYYPVRLIKEYPFHQLPSKDVMIGELCGEDCD